MKKFCANTKVLFPEKKSFPTERSLQGLDRIAAALNQLETGRKLSSRLWRYSQSDRRTKPEGASLFRGSGGGSIRKMYTVPKHQAQKL